jgi:hypothetical protein
VLLEGLELRRSCRPLVRGDVVLALRAGLIGCACPADHTEEPVEASVWTGATPPLFASAAGSLDAIANDPHVLMGAPENHHVTGHDETLLQKMRLQPELPKVTRSRNPHHTGIVLGIYAR